MFKKIKNVIMAVALLAAFSAPVALVPSTALAANNAISDSLCKGSNFATSASGSASCTNQGNGEATLQSIAKKVVDFLSILVGIIAVIMIIVGGFKYITSGGESGNVSGAKNTLIYAIVGLIIVALAQFIVRFVLTQTSSI